MQKFPRKTSRVMTTFGICQSPPTPSLPSLPSCPSLSPCPLAWLPLMDVLYLGWPNYCHREQNLWALRVGTLIAVLLVVGGGVAVAEGKRWVWGGGCLASIHPSTLQATSLATTYTSLCPPFLFSAMQMRCQLNAEWRVRYELSTHLRNGQERRQRGKYFALGPLMLSMTQLWTGIHS